MQEIGLEAERLEMYNMSAAEGAKFATAADEMTKIAQDLGPNPFKL